MTASKLSQHEAFSHDTALEFYGLEAARYVKAEARKSRPEEALHVCAPKRSKRVRRKGLITHLWTADMEATILGELRIVSAPACWAQMALRCNTHELMLMAAMMTCRDSERRVCSLQDLREYVERNPSFKGRRKCLAALELAPENADSPPEVDLYLLLVSNGLPAPICNYPVRDEQGQMFVDLAYPELKFGLEYEGAYHAGDVRQMRHDRNRQNRLSQQGWSILFVTKDHMQTEETKANLIRTVIQMRMRCLKDCA